jgi:hypothetical protein
MDTVQFSAGSLLSKIDKVVLHHCAFNIVSVQIVTPWCIPSHGWKIIGLDQQLKNILFSK